SEGSQTDPLSLHKYLYAHVNPVNGIDPSGHEFNFASTLASAAIMARNVAQVGLVVLQAYNRVRATIDAIQDIATVTAAVSDGWDDDDAAIIDEIIYDYAKSKLTGYAIKAVTGVGGKVLGFMGRQLTKLKITPGGIQRTRAWYKTHKRQFADKSKQ